jgi:peptidoglycan-associated lipoprotein
MKKIALVIISLLFAACASPKPSATQANSPDKTPAVASSTASAVAPSTNAVSSSNTSASDATTKLAANVQKENPGSDNASTANLVTEIQRLHNESVYFDYNEFVIKSEFKNIIEKQSENIKNHKNASVVLEGNADERGSAAYNLALGEKRATSVKKMLVTLGVPSTQIKVVSYGKSKPVMDCHEEKCWQENRRVDFKIK